MTVNPAEAKKRIERELAEVYQASDALKKEPRPEELEALGDNTPLTEDVDNALLVEDVELRSDRLQRLLERAKALEDALLRLDEGAYGVCIDCGKEIPSKRLQAVPEAIRCLEDQEKAERFEVPEKTTL